MRSPAYPLAVSSQVIPASSAASTIAPRVARVGGVAEGHGAQHQLGQRRCQVRQLGVLHAARGALGDAGRRPRRARRSRGLAPDHPRRFQRRAAQPAGVGVGWGWRAPARWRRARRPCPARSTSTSSRDGPHDAEVVRDEEVGQPGLLPQLGQHVEHLGLHRDVERAGRLVADQQVGLGGQGAGDADPLPLAAGELVRLALQRGGGQPDPVEQLGGRCLRTVAERSPRTCIGSATICWAVRCGSSEPYGSWNTIWIRWRIGRRSRSRHGREVSAVEEHRARRRLDQPHEGLGDGGLAAAGLADDGQAPAAGDRERHLVDGAEGLAAAAVLDDESRTSSSGCRRRRGSRRALGVLMLVALRWWRACRPAQARWSHRGGSATGSISSGCVRVLGVVPLAQLGDGGQQGPGVVVRGWSTTCSTGPSSTNRPRLHDVDPVAHQPGDAQVVGDQQQRDAGALLQLEEQVEDAGLDGDVEGRGRLVGDDQPGSVDRAIAMSTRWSMPPESSWG